MQEAYAGNNITGTAGLIAVDKVGNHIRFYNPENLEEITSIPSPEKTVHELAISHDRKSAFVPLYGDGIYGANKNPNNKILKIDLELRKIAGLIDLGEHVAPHGMAATPDGDLWVVCDIPDKLLRIDTVDDKIISAIDCPGNGAHQMCFAPDWQTLYVSHKEGPIGVFDMASQSFIADIALSSQPRGSGNGSGSEGIMPTPDGKNILTIDNINNALRIFDEKSRREIRHIELEPAVLTNPKRSRLAKLMISPNGKTLAMTTYASAHVWLMDAEDYGNRQAVSIAKGPQGMTFSPDSKTLLVACHDSGLLTRIDVASRQAVSAHDGGSGIEVLCTF